MLQNRYEDHARFVENDYRLGNLSIEFNFVAINHADAYVEPLVNGYSIGIAQSFPLLLKALFSRLLADTDVLPWLPLADADQSIEEKVYFSLNANEIGNQRIALQRTSTQRDNIAKLLSDIGMEFVFLHEVGHVLSGHVDAKKTMTPSMQRISELSLTRQAGTKQKDISQVWECEADIVASRLLNGYINTIIKHAQSDDDGLLPTSLWGPKDIVIEQCLSLTVAAIYTLFRFLRGTSEKLQLHGHHPDPLVRVFCIRSALYQTVAARHNLNKELLEDLIDARLQEFGDALDYNGVLSDIPFDHETVALLENSLNDLLAKRKRYAHLVNDHRYFDWSDV